MIVYPTKDTPKLGRKNIDAKTPEQAFAIYRKRFAPLADALELTAETNNGKKFGSGGTGVVGSDNEIDGADSTGAGID